MRRLHYSSKCLSNAMHIAAIKPGNAHTPAGNEVDTKLFTQTINLCSTQTGVAEHAALFKQIVKVSPPERPLSARSPAPDA